MAIENYVKTNWIDNAAPAINAANLLNIENGIETATDAIQVLEDTAYVLPPAEPTKLGGVMAEVIANGDGTFTGVFNW